MIMVIVMIVMIMMIIVIVIIMRVDYNDYWVDCNELEANLGFTKVFYPVRLPESSAPLLV